MKVPDDDYYEGGVPHPAFFIFLRVSTASALLSQERSFPPNIPSPEKRKNFTKIEMLILYYTTSKLKNSKGGYRNIYPVL
jgi:hypothetical protein